MTEETPPRDFPVAMSFSGEKRHVALEVAGHQIRHFGEGRVFVDEIFLHEMGRFDLDSFLQELFRDRTDLVVVLNSRGYATKPWCRTEWRAIRSLVQEGRKGIMLLRLDDAKPPEGAFTIDHFLDVSKKSSEEISELIVRRYHSEEASKKRAVGKKPAAESDEKSVQVIVKLPMELASFDQQRQQVFQDGILMLAKNIFEVEHLEMERLEPGSVRVHLRMTESLAIEVCRAASQGHIGQFPVLFWRAVQPGAKFLEAVGAGHGWNKLSRRQGGYWGPAHSWGRLLDQAAEIIPDPFVLINVISKRVKQLNSGRSPLIRWHPGISAGQMALMEFIEGKLRLVER